MSCISGPHRAADVPLRLASIAMKRGDSRRDSRNYRHYRRYFVQRGYSPLGAARSRFASRDRRLLTNKLCHNGLIGVAARADASKYTCVQNAIRSRKRERRGRKVHISTPVKPSENIVKYFDGFLFKQTRYVSAVLKFQNRCNFNEIIFCVLYYRFYILHCSLFCQIYFPSFVINFIFFECIHINLISIYFSYF